MAQLEVGLTPEEAIVRHDSWVIDCSAFVGLPQPWADEAAQRLIDSLDDFQGEWPMRPVYERIPHPSNAKFPLEVNWREKDQEPVPLVLLPAPNAVRQVANDAPAAEPLGLTSESAAFDMPLHQGRTLFFTAGEKSERPITIPAMPQGASLSPGIFIHSDTMLRLGKLVASAGDSFTPQSRRTLAKLRLGEPGGAEVQGWLTTTTVADENPRLRYVKFVDEEGSEKRWIAYAMADANGARRARGHVLPDGSSVFAKPLASPAHDPKVGRHSLLRIPRPLDRTSGESGQEDLAMDEWFAEASQSDVWALRRRPDETPYRESYVLSPAAEDSDLPLHEVYLWSSADKEMILQTLQQIAASVEK